MEGQKIIYCDGTFDLFHSGHINFLKSCKEMGNYLIVGVISDENVNSYKRYPVLNLKDRVKILQHIDFIDEVIPDCPFKNITKEFLEEKKISLVVYGTPDGNPGWEDHYQEAMKKNIMKYVKYGYEELSTSKIISKIKTEY
jgi:ethanolamine-phosphate cytidylyltransferase